MAATGSSTALQRDLPLEMRRVTRKYGKKAGVDGLNLHVGLGEIVILLGPNGAGKSTTISLALGFIKPDSGTVSVAGIDMGSQPRQARGRTGYIPENVHLYPSLSGLENLEYFSALAGSSFTHDQLRAALREAGLAPDTHDRRTSQYSKGMRQKTGIALATIRKSQLLLLDEPTSGLDPVASDEFNGLLLRMASTGTGILMATHDIAAAREVASRVLLLGSGRLLRSLDRAELSPCDLQQVYIDAMRESKC